METIHCPTCGHHIADLQPAGTPDPATPARIDARTELRKFLAERTVQRPGSRERSVDVYDAYVDWCHEDGIERMSRRMFGLAIEDMSEVKKVRSNGERYITGHKLM